MNTLEQKWGRCVQAGIRKAKPVRYLGINAQGMRSRQLQYWSDLAALCREFWGLSIRMDLESVGHIHFEATGPEGSRLGVTLTGAPDGSYLDVLFDVKKGGLSETIRHKFGPENSLKVVIEWIDRKALAAARGM